MKFISIGRIAGTYGLDGELKIKPNTSSPELFSQMEFLLLTQDNELKRSLKIEDIREHNNLLIVRLKGIASESDAAKLKGLNVSITEDMLPKADDDEVYWFEIENLPVVTSDKKEIGRLVDLMESGSTDIFRIALQDGRYALISNNKDHVLEINTEGRYVVISEQGLVYEDL